MMKARYHQSRISDQVNVAKEARLANANELKLWHNHEDACLAAAVFFYKGLERLAPQNEAELNACLSPDAPTGIANQIFTAKIPHHYFDGRNSRSLAIRGQEAIVKAFKARRPGQSLEDTLKQATSNFIKFIAE